MLPGHFGIENLTECSLVSADFVLRFAQRRDDAAGAFANIAQPLISDSSIVKTFEVRQPERRQRCFKSLRTNVEQLQNDFAALRRSEPSGLLA